MVPFEKLNSEAYVKILRIEIVIREVVREKYFQEFGRKWKKRIPGELLTKIRESEKNDDLISETGYVALGSLYYLTYGEIISAIEKQNKIRQALELELGANFLDLCGHIRAPRNAIAHNRSITRQGANDVNHLYEFLNSKLSPEKFEDYARNPTAGLFIEDAKIKIKEYLNDVLSSVKSFKIIEQNNILDLAIEQHWWSTVADNDLNFEKLESCAELISKYSKLTHVGIGTSGKINRFIHKNNFAGLVTEAIASIK